MTDAKPAWEYLQKAKVARTRCGCVIRFVDGVERRIRKEPGYPAFEVDVVQKCRYKRGGGCGTVFNRADQAFYVRYDTDCYVPDDPLAAELMVQFR